MASNRTVIRCKSLRGQEFWASMLGVAGAESYILALRNSMRAAFPSPRYIVSDICKWSGTSYTTARGYVFVFRDTDKNQEWAFCFRASTSSNDYMYNAFGGSSANLGSHLKSVSGTSVSNAAAETESRPWVIFNHDTALSFNLGFNGATPLTYTGGDFSTPPPTNPSTSLVNLSAMMPGSGAAPRLPTVWGASFVGSTSNYNRWGFMYDRDIGFLRMVYQDGGHPTHHLSVFSGKLYRSNADGGLASASDPYNHGVACLQHYGSSGSSMGTPLSTAPLRCFFARADGSVDLAGFSVEVSPVFSRATHLDGSDLRIRPIEIQSAGYLKGYLDPRIIAEVGADSDQSMWRKRIQYPDANNPLIRDHYRYSSAWHENLPMIGDIPDDGVSAT